MTKPEIRPTGWLPSDHMNSEWEAWQDVVREFRKVRIDVNDPRFDLLMKYIRIWGEYLVSLRVDQSEEVRQSAMSDALAALD